MRAQRGPAEASGSWAQACRWHWDPGSPGPPWGLEVLSERKSSEQKGWLLKVSQWGSGPCRELGAPSTCCVPCIGVGFSSGWLSRAPASQGSLRGRGEKLIVYK